MMVAENLPTIDLSPRHVRGIFLPARNRCSDSYCRRVPSLASVSPIYLTNGLCCDIMGLLAVNKLH